MSDYEEWENPIGCIVCQKLLGYAPYMRKDYVCPQCHKGTTNDRPDEPR